MPMIALRPVALSCQNATCSCPSADSGGVGSDPVEGDVETDGGDMVTVVTPCVRTWGVSSRAHSPYAGKKTRAGDSTVTSHFRRADMAPMRRFIYLADTPKWT